jgi:hypothetical protein
MEKVFSDVFTNLQEVVAKNLEKAKKGILPDKYNSSILGGSGSLPFNFQLDSNGQYTYSVSQYGAGKTLNCSAYISNPNATFDIKISSSDGGGGQWNGIVANQQIHFNIETSFWHSTTITVYIKASVQNQNGSGEINYNY